MVLAKKLWVRVYVPHIADVTRRFYETETNLYLKYIEINKTNLHRRQPLHRRSFSLIILHVESKGPWGSNRLPLMAAVSILDRLYLWGSLGRRSPLALAVGMVC